MAFRKRSQCRASDRLNQASKHFNEGEIRNAEQKIDGARTWTKTNLRTVISTVCLSKASGCSVSFPL
jgi:hypothetical protein